MIGIDLVLTESSTDSSLYFDTARGPRSVCTMPVTGKTSGVVWDRISSFDAEWGRLVGGQGQGQEPGGRGTRKIEKQLGCEAEEIWRTPSGEKEERWGEVGRIKEPARCSSRTVR
jgi:hypothetical protein